ncbi:MAG TPA: hypothetical protein EYQ50_22985, partial [Verrucomicrobiales bacterium]|nr:hypothetical protein [Verrucomicrobiales bacterium]
MEPGIRVTGNISVIARDTSGIDAEAFAASIAASFGAIGGSVSIGVSLAENTIKNSVEAYVAGATVHSSLGDLTVHALENATINSRAEAAAVAASLSIGVSFAGGGAETGLTVLSATRAFVDQSSITLTGDLNVNAASDTNGNAKVDATAVSIGLIAAAAAGSVATIHVSPIVEAFVDRSDIWADDIIIEAFGHMGGQSRTSGMSVSTGISVGGSSATVRGSASARSGVRNDSTITANFLKIGVQSSDRFRAFTEASSGGLLAGIAGAVSDVSVTHNTFSTLGDNTVVNVDTLHMASNHDGDLDAAADAVALGLVAGTGGLVFNSVESVAKVIVGRNSTITANDNILITAFNDLTKDDQSIGENLYSGSAGLASLSALVSDTQIGSAGNAFEAGVSVGPGTHMTVLGDLDNPGLFDIETLARVKAVDSAKLEGVSLFGLSIIMSEIQANTLSSIDLNGATLENLSGDIYLTSRTNGRTSPTGRLYTAGALTVALADSDAILNALNRITVTDTTIKGGDVHLFAGKNKNGEINLLGGLSNVEITTVSLIGITDPDPTFTINETNHIDIRGETLIQSLKDIELVTRTGLPSATLNSLAVNISLLPFLSGSFNGQVTPNTTNLVTIGGEVKMEAAINNIAQVRILPMFVSGVQQLDPAKLGTQLTAAEKIELGLSPDVKYEFALVELDLTNDETGEITSALDGKFFVIKPVDLPAPKLIYVNLSSVLVEQRDKLQGLLVSHGNNAEAVARYQAQLEAVNDALVDLGLVSEAGDGVQFVKKDFNVIFVDLPDVIASPGSIFIEADSTPLLFIAPLVGNQLVARAGAEVNILNKSPFTLNVNNAVIKDNRRIDLVNGELVTFEPGNVYFNKEKLTDVTDDTEKRITILQDSLSFDTYGVDLTYPDGLPQDIYVSGSVRNENGPVTIDNKEGSINITGEVRAQTLDVEAAGDFSLNVEDWFHLRDPRQFVDFNGFRANLRNEAGNTSRDVFDPIGGIPSGLPQLEPAIFTDNQESSIVAHGRVDISARYVNINGLIQSGLHSVTLNITNEFNPGKTTSFIDDQGNYLKGLSFAENGESIDGYFDRVSENIVIDDVVAEAGRINITGQILSTGNGELRVGDGKPRVEINNESPFNLVLNAMDLDAGKVGKITLIDTVSLRRVEYEVSGDNIREESFQGQLINGTIEYTLTGSALSHSFGDAILYQPEEGRHYLWTEGQEATQTTVEVFEDKAFDIGIISIDALVADENRKSQNFEFTDDQPLLES